MPESRRAARARARAATAATRKAAAARPDRAAAHLGRPADPAGDGARRLRRPARRRQADRGPRRAPRPDWWLKKLVEREQIAVLPPSLALRKEDAELDDTPRPAQRRGGGTPRGRGLQRAGDRRPLPAPRGPAADHDAARRRRDGRGLARAAYGAARRAAPQGAARHARPQPPPSTGRPHGGGRRRSLRSAGCQIGHTDADTPAATFRSMSGSSKSAKDFFRPLAVGAPDAAARDPGPAEPGDPLLRPEQREDGRQGPRHGRHGRRPARQPRGRDQGRQQGGRPRGPGEDRAGHGLRRRPSCGPGSTRSTAPGCSTT